MTADNGCLLGEHKSIYDRGSIEYDKGCLFFTHVYCSSIICRLQYLWTPSMISQYLWGGW